MSRRIFDEFEGEWIIDRKISGFGIFFGKGVFFRRSKESYLYEERGTMRRKDGTQFAGAQKYIYKFDEKKNLISIHFGREENKLFHFLKIEFDFRQNTIVAKGYHRCIRDDYFARFEFWGKKFISSYTVSGPKKDYIIISTYSKIIE